MSTEDLAHLVSHFVELSFPESAQEKRDTFSTNLIQQIQKWRRDDQRTFSIGSEESDELIDVEIQTDNCQPLSTSTIKHQKPVVDEDRDLLSQLSSGKILHRNLEQICGPSHAVAVRRNFLKHSEDVDLDGLPFQEYNYNNVNGACCENLIGYVPVPIGIAGPLLVNGIRLHIPLATTEGALVASTNRGCKALVNGVTSIVFSDGMTRAPVLNFKSIVDAIAFKNWLETPEVYNEVKRQFESTSNFCRLIRLTVKIDGHNVYPRFKAFTGDAMGMNMVSKATNAAIDYILKREEFKDKCEFLSLSSNYCVDKKASAVNWIDGRGKSVVAEAFVPLDTIRNILKCEPEALVELARSKLLAGSSSAVSIGGSNAHAANIVAAMFIATGQDAAQVISSGMCSTQINISDKTSLSITCTMNCLEVGTVGGGTILGPQHAMLKMLGCGGPSQDSPGNNARRLAEIICAVVLAGELSLLAAQCSNDLVKSHMTLNRSSIFQPASQLFKKDKLPSNNPTNFLSAVSESKTVKKCATEINTCMNSIL